MSSCPRITCPMVCLAHTWDTPPAWIIVTTIRAIRPDWRWDWATLQPNVNARHHRPIVSVQIQLIHHHRLNRVRFNIFLALQENELFNKLFSISAFSFASSVRDFDPRTRAFSDEELKPQPMIKKSRKQFVPDELKDDKYWARRRKNNIAAKRSRDARRQKENQIAMRARFLEKEVNWLTTVYYPS